MPYFDLSPAQLDSYRPAIREAGDFDAFWAATLAEARSFDLDVTCVPVETPYVEVSVHDVGFAGFGGDRIGAWLTVARGADGPRPAVVEFIGYGGGRDLPGESLYWACAGYAHLLVDTRGQGSVWGGGGSTADPHGNGPSVPGFTTRGIERREDYYYRRVFVDGVRAVEAARRLPGVDPSRIAVTGPSQGGGIALAVAGLVPELAAAMPDVPFLCHFERALEISDSKPYSEITEYLRVHRGDVERTLDTLSYFDGVNLAKRAKAPALFSVGLMDLICPPSTVYAAFNHYAGSSKQIITYPYNNHEGGQSHQRQAQIRWLNEVLGADEGRVHG